MLIALLLIVILKTEATIWIYEGVLNFSAIFIMIALWVKATKKQQNTIFVIAASIFAVLCIMIWRAPSFYTLLIFSVWIIIIEPILRSMRMADYFRYQDIINKKWSPHLWVIYAETILTLWRILFLGAIRILSHYWNTEQIIARWMTLFAFWYFFMYWNVKTLLPKIK